MTEPMRRRRTATSSFGVGRREGHDASGFYDRFSMPVIDGDERTTRPTTRDQLWVGDARAMDRHGDIADASVALVVTSPPYFAGKQYEEALGSEHVPSSYRDYLAMLEDVFEQCARKLEPGGRMAVNVANLGRKPYRSLSADVIRILSNRLGLLLRGEVIWLKARGANGNCAWGSFRQPHNPVLRDLTERVVIASKGRFDRAPGPGRATRQHEPSISVDEFMEATTDVWEIRPESASRVGHPAPFPVELPLRLIELYTYRGDLVLDPFMGAGATAVAAVRSGRHYVGFDTDATYIATAEQRVASEREKHRDHQTTAGEDFQARAVREGQKARVVARQFLQECGFTEIRANLKLAGGVEVNFEARDRGGRRWRFDVSGAFTVTQRPGLRRTDTLWKALGKAAALHFAETNEPDPPPLVLLSTDLPALNSSGERALKAMTGPGQPIRAAIAMLDGEAKTKLSSLSAPTIGSDQPTAAS